LTIAVAIETVQLEEIHDVKWPTDGDLVRAFRKTLQHGGHFTPIQVNRIWQEDATWYYEIIDGFHRFEAAKAEYLPALLCQVVELDERTARYARIQACLGKPSQVTRERALLELQQAFVTDMHALIGAPEILYEPILGKDGQIQPRQRTAPLPEEPMQALEVLTDHLRVTQADYPAYWVQDERRGTDLRTPFGQRTGWEQALNDWLAEMGERFGHDTYWLLEVLRLHLYKGIFSHRWVSRKGQPQFSEVHDFVRFTERLWDLPDVDLRAWFRRQVTAHPEQRERLGKVQDLLELHYPLYPDERRTGPNKQEILMLLTLYPSIYSLLVALRKQQQATQSEPDDTSVPELEAPSLQPQPELAEVQSNKPPVEGQQDAAIFAVISPRFVSGSPLSSPSATKSLPSSLPRPTPTVAYEPVHTAFQALLRAIELITEQYGREWLDWESAQADRMQLRAALDLG
jgi:hypothetical protein